MMEKFCIKREIFKGELSKSNGVLTERLVNALKAINNWQVYSQDNNVLGFWQRQSEDAVESFGNLIIIEGNLFIVDSKYGALNLNNVVKFQTNFV